MSDPKAKETNDAVTPQPLSVEAKVYPSKIKGQLLAFAKVTLGGVFVVHDIRIFNSEKGPFVSLPAEKRDGKRYEVCHPATAEMRKSLNSAVLGEYQRVMESLTERDTGAKTSVRESLSRGQKKATPVKVAAGPTKQRKVNKGAR